MSTFIHSEKQYQNIYAGIMYLLPESKRQYFLAAVTGKSPGDLDTEIPQMAETIDLLNCWYAANVQAYNNRYNEKKEFRFINFKLPDRAKYGWTIPGLVKAIQSVHYNSSEATDEAPEKWAGVLESMDRAVAWLCVDIVTDSPEYDKADTWG